MKYSKMSKPHKAGMPKVHGSAKGPTARKIPESGVPREIVQAYGKDLPPEVKKAFRK